jgi:hypothetical protein
MKAVRIEEFGGPEVLQTQIYKHLGAVVIATAGSDEKVSWES